MSEETRNALSTFLYRTGTPTKKFMLVFSTNEPAAFDRAATDRVDEVVELALPSQAERVRLLDMYFTQHIVSGASGAKPIVVDDQAQVASWDALSKRLEGFSGRQIEKLCLSWQVCFAIVLCGLTFLT